MEFPTPVDPEKLTQQATAIRRSQPVIDRTTADDMTTELQNRKEREKFHEYLQGLSTFARFLRFRNDFRHAEKYHVEGEMETIGEMYAIDVALLNIGGHFGMEPKMAARAAESLRAKLAIPHHFATFPGITPDASEFAAALKTRRIAFREMKPGETLTFQGSRIK